MKQICQICGGVAEFVGKNWYKEEVFKCTVCHTAGYYQRFKEQPTVFDRITQSPEVLAPLLVWQDYDWCVFRSTVIDCGEFNYKEEAIAATVEKLKEVEK